MKITILAIIAITITGCTGTTSTLGVEGVDVTFLGLKGLITSNNSVNITINGTASESVATKAMEVAKVASASKTEIITAGDLKYKTPRNTEW